MTWKEKWQARADQLGVPSSEFVEGDAVVTRILRRDWHNKAAINPRTCEMRGMERHIDHSMLSLDEPNADWVYTQGTEDAYELYPYLAHIGSKTDVEIHKLHRSLDSTAAKCLCKRPDGNKIKISKIAGEKLDRAIGACGVSISTIRKLTDGIAERPEFSSEPRPAEPVESWGWEQARLEKIPAFMGWLTLTSSRHIATVDAAMEAETGYLRWSENHLLDIVEEGLNRAAKCYPITQDLIGLGHMSGYAEGVLDQAASIKGTADPGVVRVALRTIQRNFGSEIEYLSEDCVRA